MKQSLASFLKWLATIAVAIGVVMCIRYFLVESYRVSTDAMEEALHKGDYILVNKLQERENPGRNRVVLFTSPLRKDTLSAPLFLARCIGMPGDTIEISNEGYKINGVQLPPSPRALSTYFVAQNGVSDFLNAAKKLNIPIRDRVIEPYGFTLSLTTFEEYQIREELDDDANGRFLQSKTSTYTLVVPRKDRAYRLNETTLNACKEAILKETGNRAVIRDGKLYLDGKETLFFFFKQDYYWMLADNTNESVDSRHLGFIPSSHIIGNAWFCWYSTDKQHFFKPVK